MTRTSLKDVDPKGRIDVALYRLAERGVRHYENNSGISGLWDMLEKDVSKILQKGLAGVNVPPELKVIAELLRGKNTLQTSEPNAQSK